MSTTALPSFGNRQAGLPPVVGAAPARVRHITPQAGRALEILGQAIEYLTDEYVHDRGYLNPDDARMDAIQLLMRLNREVYFQCPVARGFATRCRELLGHFIHPAHTH